MSGSELKAYRQSLGLSAERASKLLGVHISTLFRWESATKLAIKLRWVKLALSEAKA